MAKRVGVVLSPVTRVRRAARLELFWAVPRAERLRLCAELVNGSGDAIVYCRTARDAVRVATDLSRLGVPAAWVEHRDFGSSRVRARLVTDETAPACTGAGARCIIQFDPAESPRRYRRRNDLVAGPGAVVVSFVVPEREAQARSLLHGLDLPDVLTSPDVAAVSGALASPQVGDGAGGPPAPARAWRAAASRVLRRLRAGPPRVKASLRSLRRPG